MEAAKLFRRFIDPVKPVVTKKSTRMLRPGTAIAMLEEGNNALAERVNAQSHAIIQLWSKLQELENER